MTIGSNLSSAEDKLEWLQSYLPPNVLEGYKELWANSVIGLGVQSALLIRGERIERERRNIWLERPLLMICFFCVGDDLSDSSGAIDLQASTISEGLETDV